MINLPIVINPPKFIFMEVNKRCNLRCTHCDFWKRNDKDKAKYLSSEMQKMILDEFSKLSDKKGSLVICGGEPMLDLDIYYRLAEHARKADLKVLSVVNGTQIKTQKDAERMLREGPHEVSISFDDFREKEHDMLRGINGAFEKSVNAVKLLVEARDKLKIGKVNIMGLIHAKNYEFLDKFFNFALNELKADKLKINSLQPTFGGIGPDQFFAEYSSGLDPDKFVDMIKKCGSEFNIPFNPKYLSSVHQYWSSLQKKDHLSLLKGWGSLGMTKKPICNSYERNIMIDHYGVARLCFSKDFSGKTILQSGDLTKFWIESNNIREKMIGCKRPCGISHSVRRESATIS